MICFLITTYNRPKSCKKLVKELLKHGDVYLLSDGSCYGVDESWTGKYELYYQTQVHLGKKYYTETVNRLWKMPIRDYDYYFMVPDDFYPVSGFVESAINTWKSIRNGKKICLTTYVEKSRIDKACWTKFTPIEYKHYRLTQWTDLCFMCKKQMFEEIGRIPRSKINWNKRPHMGSGTGAHISSTLYRAGWNLYQTKRSLFTVQPEAFKSQMNPMRKKSDPINKPIL